MTDKPRRLTGEELTRFLNLIPDEIYGDIKDHIQAMEAELAEARIERDTAFAEHPSDVKSRITWAVECQRMAKDRDHALASLEKAKEALRWYADFSNYVLREYPLGGGRQYPVLVNQGAWAKDCLRELEKP